MRRMIAPAFFIICTILLTTASRRADEPTEADYLSAAVSPDLLPFTGIDVPARENIAIVTDASGRSLELRLLPNQPLLHGGIRAEISIDYPFQEGETISYRWRMRLVSPFPPDPQRRWWLVGDWHDQPDRSQFETWDNFPSNSPPILVSYGNVDGKDMLGFNYGPRQEFVRALPITLDQWITIEAVIHWSRDSNGSLMVYIDGSKEPYLHVTGSNMLNGFQHYLKLGLYRHRDINTANAIQINSVTIHRVI